MTRDEAVKITRTTLDKWLLSQWKIRLTTDLRQPWVGKCSYSDKTIYLNAHHIDTHPREEVINTIYHEIAHALTPMHQHDDVWAAKAREVGCDNTQPCMAYGLSATAIDAIRSGAILEVEVEEQVIRTPKYKITRLQDKCPDCGKVAKERTSFEIAGRKVILLECGHTIVKIAESYSPFEKIVFDGLANCKHEWQGTICQLCNAKKLFPFQVEGARNLEKYNGRFGIFDEMGLGKTIQALAYLKHHKEVFPVLFIVKSGIKFQWAREIVRILGINYFPQVVMTSHDKLLPSACYIVGYDMLVTKVRTRNGKTITSGFDINKFKEAGVKCVVIDECQQISNPDSSRTQQVRRIVREVQHFIPLSGTPWKNRGSEFFPVLNMLDPQRFYSFEAFKNRWVEWYWDGNKQKMGGIAKPKEFKEFVADLIIRREQKEVLRDLPSLSRVAFYAQMNEDYAKAYTTELNDFVKFWEQAVIGGEEDDFATSQGILARLTRMRHLTGLAKLPNTVEMAKEFLEETDRKLVIFAHHKDVAQIIFDQLKQWCAEHNEPQPLKLDGGMDSAQRDDIQRCFNSPNSRLLIASMLASGEGLNLQTCSDCIIHERQWNPANEEQVEKRFHRIGQVNPVKATYMLAQNTMDDIFHGLVEKKRSQFHAAMNKGEQVISWNESGLIKELAQAIVNSAKGK